MLILRMGMGFLYEHEGQCEINGVVKRIAWLNHKTLVIEPIDFREVYLTTRTDEDGDTFLLWCSDKQTKEPDLRDWEELTELAMTRLKKLRLRVR